MPSKVYLCLHEEDYIQNTLTSQGVCVHIFFWCLMFCTVLSIHLESTFDILFGILSCFHWRDGQRMQSALLKQTGVLLYNLFCVFAIVHI